MTMDITKLITAAPDWTDQTWAARMDAAASLLFLHGYIPQSQREKITRKIGAEVELTRLREREAS